MYIILNIYFAISLYVCVHACVYICIYLSMYVGLRGNPAPQIIILFKLMLTFIYKNNNICTIYIYIYIGPTITFLHNRISCIIQTEQTVLLEEK